jgi:hypothetical protein
VAHVKISESWIVATVDRELSLGFTAVELRNDLVEDHGVMGDNYNAIQITWVEKTATSHQT